GGMGGSASAKSARGSRLESGLPGTTTAPSLLPLSSNSRDVSTSPPFFFSSLWHAKHSACRISIALRDALIPAGFRVSARGGAAMHPPPTQSSTREIDQ